MFSLVKTALSTEPKSKFTLFFGNRASSAVLFREEIEDLKNLYMDRFSLVYVMSRETQDIELFNGRLDGDKVDQLMSAWMSPADIDYAFVCGPQTMTESVVERLQARGIPKSNIKFELFGAPRPARPAHRPGSPTGSRQVRSHRGAGRPQQDVRHRQEQGQRAGFGAGARDRTAVLVQGRGVFHLPLQGRRGEVDMDANFALEDYEVARGFILSCQSFPVSDRLVIDFDQET